MCHIWPLLTVCCGTVALNYLSKLQAPQAILPHFIKQQSAAIRTSNSFQSTIHMHSQMKKKEGI